MDLKLGFLVSLFFLEAKLPQISGQNPFFSQIEFAKLFPLGVCLHKTCLLATVLMFLYKSVTSEGEICQRILASIATMKKIEKKKEKQTEITILFNIYF